MFCSNCGQNLADGTRFCGFCGTAVAAAQGAAVSPPPAQSAAPAATPAAPAPPQPPPPPLPGAAPAGAGAAAAAAMGSMRQAIDARAPGLINRVTNILLRPASEWEVIAGEKTTAGEIYTGYVAPLGAIGPIATLIGMSLIGVSVPFAGHVRTPILLGLATLIVSYLFVFVSVFLVAWIVNMLAPTFGGQKDSMRALRVTAYSYTAAWVAGILHLLPSLGVLVIIAALYGLYLLYLGLPVLMGCPKDKAVGYTVVTVLCAIVVWVVIGLITSAIMVGVGLGGMGMMSRTTNWTSPSSSKAESAAAAASVLSGVFGGKTAEDKERMQGALQQLEKLGQQAQQAPQSSAGGSSSGTSAAPSAPVDAAQALNAVGQVLSGGQKVNVVDFRDLKAMLPDTLAGMPRKDVSGERTEAMGMQTSHATAHYRDAAGGSLQVEIADLGSMSGLAGLALKFNPNVEKETERGYERTTTVNGQLLHEEYDRVSKSGEVNAIVGNRFSVEVRGSGVDMDVMKKSIAQIDMGKLAAVASAK